MTNVHAVRERYDRRDAQLTQNLGAGCSFSVRSDLGQSGIVIVYGSGNYYGYELRMSGHGEVYYLVDGTVFTSLDSVPGNYRGARGRIRKFEASKGIVAELLKEHKILRQYRS